MGGAAAVTPVSGLVQETVESLEIGQGREIGGGETHAALLEGRGHLNLPTVNIAQQ